MGMKILKVNEARLVFNQMCGLYQVYRPDGPCFEKLVFENRVEHVCEKYIEERNWEILR